MNGLVFSKICTICGVDKWEMDFGVMNRNKNGTAPSCKSCRRLHYIYNPERTISKEKQVYYKRKNNLSYKITNIIYSLEHRAKKKNIPFDKMYFTRERVEKMISEQKRCSICNVEVVYGSGVGHTKNNIMALDRLIPEKGYVSGNVYILCFRCNLIKSVGDEFDHDRISRFIKKKKRLIKNKSQ